MFLLRFTDIRDFWVPADFGNSFYRVQSKQEFARALKFHGVYYLHNYLQYIYYFSY